MQDQLKAKGYADFTLKEVVNKMKKMRQKYKFEKDKRKKSGNGRSKKWAFFEQMDRFLSQRHNVTPVALVDTMEESEKMDHYCDDSSDDDQSLGLQQESKSSLLNFTSYLSHNVTCLNFFGS